MDNSCFLGTEGLRDLALYSHLVPALATFVLGIFALLRSEERVKAWYFFLFTSAFALWLSSDLVNWMSDDYYLVAATWAPLDYLEIVFFALLAGFACVDMLGSATSRAIVFALAVGTVAPFVITIMGTAVFEFNQPLCEMAGNEFLAQYKIAFEVLMLILVFGAGLWRVLHAFKQGVEQVRSALVALSIVLFMGILAGTEFYSTQTGVYEVTLYSLFVLPLFILLLTITITSYGTFKLGDASVKVLFYIFLILAGTQFFFVQSMQDFSLALMSFVVVGALGLLLYRSNEREIAFRHEVERLSSEKSEFMAFASHEIRNPITAMRGYASLIMDGTTGEANEQTTKAAEQILLTGDEVLMLIAQFLDRSKLELGKISYSIAPFNMSKAVVQLAEGFKTHITNRGLQLYTTIDPDIVVTGDLGKFKEVLGNLLDNALKYTREGAVTVHVQASGDKARVTVSDTGAGIAEEVLPKLFQKFSRADAQKANLLGTGLGLYLGKTFTEGMGGKIWAESEGKGKGARFSIELPRA